jgi:L-serine dehydratase
MCIVFIYSELLIFKGGHMSVFDIVGPVMIGPSSSHTAGAARIGLMARKILKDEPIRADITVYGSFAKTYKGHGTDKALVAGLLGFSADDIRLRSSFEIAKELGMAVTLTRSEEETDHPNTVRIKMEGKTGTVMEIVGVSLGGGRIEIREINGFYVEITGEEYTLLTFHHDQPGIIAKVTTIMALGAINVSTMRVFRSAKNANAVMIICTDSPLPSDLKSEICNISAIQSVIALSPL